jgi:hypothetical protein
VSVKTLLLQILLFFFLGHIEVGSWVILKYSLTSEGLTFVFVGTDCITEVPFSAMGISYWLTFNIAG